MAADLYSVAVCVLHRALYTERLHVTPCFNRTEHVRRIEFCSYSTAWSVERSFEIRGILRHCALMQYLDFDVSKQL